MKPFHASRKISDHDPINTELANRGIGSPSSINKPLENVERSTENKKELGRGNGDLQRTSYQIEPTSKSSVYQDLGWLDRLLALWILLAIVIGILLGNYVESVSPALQRGKFVQVSVPIGISRPRILTATSNSIAAVGLLVMMYPILCKVKYESLHRAFAHRQIWIQIGFSGVMNWIVAPLLMVSYTSCSCGRRKC